MKTASWVLLAVAGALTMLGSLASVGIAYGTDRDQIGPASLSELSAGRPEVATAVRARRATAAAYGVGFATLFLLITLGPYRRGGRVGMVGATSWHAGCYGVDRAASAVPWHTTNNAICGDWGGDGTVVPRATPHCWSGARSRCGAFEAGAPEAIRLSGPNDVAATDAARAEPRGRPTRG